MSMILYSYWRSSCSWRVRIGLHLKQVEFKTVPVNLLEGEHQDTPHISRNALGQVPVLELGDGTQIRQSLAILDWLDRTHPLPPLFPSDPVAGATALSLAEIVNAGIQPLQNLAVLKAIEALGGDRTQWGREVIERGLQALAKHAKPTAGAFLVGDTVSIADLCLVPQLYNARRFGCDLSSVGLLTEIEARCNALPSFQAAHPDNQPDAK